MNQSLLNFRTVDELFEDLSLERSKFVESGELTKTKVIKIAMRVNQELGLNINQTINKVIDVEDYKARLPKGLYKIERALFCTDFKIFDIPPQGTHIEEIDFTLDPLFPEYKPYPDEIDVCNKEIVDPCLPKPDKKPRLVMCNNDVKLIQKVKGNYYEYSKKFPLYITSNPYIDFDCEGLCPNSPYRARIVNNFLEVNFKYGKIFLTYISKMENDEGELIVLDDPIVNEFYEAAVDYDIFKNKIYDGEQQMMNQYQISKEELRVKKAKAKNLIQTPSYNSLIKLFNANRIVNYRKFYNIMK